MSVDLGGGRSRVGAVAVGRNEGARLRLCLASLVPQADALVYVDSGSADGSPALARAMGVEVLELDPQRPFSAARGRDEGARLLLARGGLDHLQFVDADCLVEPGWVAAAAEALDADPSLGIVTGWRREEDPRRNLFHGLLEEEWHGPTGEIDACGGDMMVRAEAYLAAGGFDARLVSSEDEEFVWRLRARTGLRAVRLPRPMTVHDARMDRLGQWWRRMVRAGLGFEEVAARFPANHRGERLRAWVYAGAVPGIALLGLLLGQPLLLLALLAWPLNWARTARGLRGRGLPWARAGGQAALLVLAKLPTLQGMLAWRLRRMRGVGPRLIEYK